MKAFIISAFYFPLKACRLILSEIRALFEIIIIYWPKTALGNRLRTLYWRNKTGVKNIVVGRGSTLFDSDLMVFGENIDIGDDVEFVVDGVDGLKVFIGSNILIARGVYLRSANHRFNDPNKLIMQQGHTSKKINYHGSSYSIVIESDVWVGANVIILSGAMIGEGAVIGAGSIVIGVIPPYSVAVGCPAKVVSNRGETKSSI